MLDMIPCLDICVINVLLRTSRFHDKLFALLESKGQGKLRSWARKLLSPADHDHFITLSISVEGADFKKDLKPRQPTVI